MMINIAVLLALAGGPSQAASPAQTRPRLPVGTASVTGSAKIVSAQKTTALRSGTKLRVGDQIIVANGASVNIRQVNGQLQTFKSGKHTIKYQLSKQEEDYARRLKHLPKAAAERSLYGYWPYKSDPPVIASARDFSVFIETEMPGPLEVVIDGWPKISIWAGELTEVAPGEYRSSDLNQALASHRRSQTRFWIWLSPAEEWVEFQLVSVETDESLHMALQEANNAPTEVLRKLARIIAYSSHGLTYHERMELEILVGDIPIDLLADRLAGARE